MSAVLAPTIRDDAQDLIRQHKGDAAAALVACLSEIDRLGLLLERATISNSCGYSRGRIRPHRGVVSVNHSPKKEILDV